MRQRWQNRLTCLANLMSGALPRSKQGGQASSSQMSSSRQVVQWLLRQMMERWILLPGNTRHPVGWAARNG